MTPTGAGTGDNSPAPGRGWSASEPSRAGDAALTLPSDGSPPDPAAQRRSDRKEAENGGSIQSLQEVRRAVAESFRAAGLDTPDLDARILTAHALGLDHAGLAREASRILNAGAREAIAALARRRLGREPVARIVGRKEFWSLDLEIGPATLVPRPETETVVEAALAEIVRRGGRNEPLRIADLGTGSGAILLALLSELPNACGIGTDIDPDALVIARANARRLGISRANFVACDMAAALGGPFDVIVANPPYVPSAALAALPLEVRDFDPRAALDGGADGLDFYRAIAAAAPALLAPHGVVVVELGELQAEAAAELFTGAGLAVSPPHPDLRGTARALVARKGHECQALEPGKKTLGMSGGTD